MSIITISRGSFSHGKAVAEAVARELNYKCISREVILAASEQFNIPEIALLQAIKNPPSFIERFTYGKQKYVSYARSGLLDYAEKDNVVYHGFAGHFLLDGVPNVLKVRICASLEERVALVMKRENLSRKKSLKMLRFIDNERRRWAIHFYGKDPSNLCLYDLGLVISTLSLADAVKNILFTVRLPEFQTTPASHKIVMNLALAARVKSRLMDYFPEADVSVENHTAIVHIHRSLKQAEALTEDIRAIVMEMPGVEDVRVNVIPAF